MFLFSNLSLFVFLPFAYLFTESEGFVGHRKVEVPIYLWTNRQSYFSLYFRIWLFLVYLSFPFSGSHGQGLRNSDGIVPTRSSCSWNDLRLVCSHRSPQVESSYVAQWVVQDWQFLIYWQSTKFFNSLSLHDWLFYSYFFQIYGVITCHFCIRASLSLASLCSYVSEKSQKRITIN